MSGVDEARMEIEETSVNNDRGDVRTTERDQTR